MWSFRAHSHFARRWCNIRTVETSLARDIALDGTSLPSPLIGDVASPSIWEWFGVCSIGKKENKKLRLAFISPMAQVRVSY